MSHYRPEVLTNANYEAVEDIDGDDWPGYDNEGGDGYDHDDGDTELDPAR